LRADLGHRCRVEEGPLHQSADNRHGANRQHAVQPNPVQKLPAHKRANRKSALPGHEEERGRCRPHTGIQLADSRGVPRALGVIGGRAKRGQHHEHQCQMPRADDSQGEDRAHPQRPPDGQQPAAEAVGPPAEKGLGQRIGEHVGHAHQPNL